MSENQAKDQPQPVFIEELIQSDDTAQIEAVFEELSPVEIARVISDLNLNDQIHLWEMLGPDKSADTFSKISGLGASAVIAQLPPEQAAAIVKKY